MEHDPRCEGLDDEKLVADVKKYGWHVVKILEKDETPGWAFSVGLYKNFNHPEIVVFGLNDEVAHFLINAIGDLVRAGNRFAAACGIHNESFPLFRSEKHTPAH